MEHAARAGTDPYARSLATSALGLEHLARGEFPEAAGHYESPLELPPWVHNPGNQAAMTLLHPGTVALHRGEPGAAVEYFEQARKINAVSLNPLWSVWSLQGVGQRQRELGNYPQAIDLLTECHAARHRLNQMSGMASALVALAIVDLRLGNPQRPRKLLSAAAGSPRMLEDVAEFRTTCAMLREATGDAITGSHGPPALAPEILELLAQVRVEGRLVTAGRGTTDQLPYSLTRREMDVLAMVSAGKPNRAIADALSISERTVENHASHLLAKLDVDSWTAAVALASQHGIVPAPRARSDR